MAKKMCILGAGPIGLDCALAAVKNGGYGVTVLERGGSVGGNVARWGHVTLFSKNELNMSQRMKDVLTKKPAMDVIPSGDELKEQVLDPVKEYLSQHDVTFHFNCNAISVGRANKTKADFMREGTPFTVLAEKNQGKEDAEEVYFGPFDVLMDCTGTYGQWRHVGIGGIPARGEKQAREKGFVVSEIPKNDASYDGKHVIIVGAGYSAATMLRNFGEGRHGAPASVTWITRKTYAKSTTKSGVYVRHENDALPERDELSKYANAIVEVNQGTGSLAMKVPIKHVVGWITGFKNQAVVVETTTETELPCDIVFSLVGNKPDNELTRELHYHQCYATEGPMAFAKHLMASKGGDVPADCLAQTSAPSEALRNSEPNYFVLGSKAYARDPSFLLKIGYEQVDSVFATMLQ